MGGPSAFQVEGGCPHHDFYDWALKGRIKDGTSPIDAVRFWDYYKGDIALMKKMNHNAARIGIEWARIEPSEGAFDDKALAHYRAILKEMRKAGIRPMVTLHHFANPMWLVREGGWENPRTIDHYLRFVVKAVESLGDLVDIWNTINEPSVYAVAAYLFGEFPPGAKRVMDATVEAHVRVRRDTRHTRKKEWASYGPTRSTCAPSILRENNRSTVFARPMDKYFNNRYSKIRRAL